MGSGFTALAFLAIRDYLRDAGEERWSVLAQPFIVMGSTLFAILPGMEFAALAAAETVQFYVQGAAGIVALWPLAYEMWKHSEARKVEKPRPMPAT